MFKYLSYWKFYCYLLDIENTNELKIITNSFYHYFTNNEGLKLDKNVKMVNSEISIIEYTEFKGKYKNNSAHKSLNITKI